MGVHRLILVGASKVQADYFGSHLFRRPLELRKGSIQYYRIISYYIIPHSCNIIPLSYHIISLSHQIIPHPPLSHHRLLWLSFVSKTFGASQRSLIQYYRITSYMSCHIIAHNYSRLHHIIPYLTPPAISYH